MSHSKRLDACLYIEDRGNTYRVGIGENRMSVGKGTDCDILLRDKAIGDIAAEIITTPRGYDIRENTRGNVQINGKQTTGRQRLHHGDILTIGSARLRFYEIPEVSDTTLQLGVVTPGGELFFFITDQSIVHIGQTTGDLRIPDTAISDPHLSIENMGDEAIYVRQLSGNTTTLLNGESLTGRRRLVDSDSLEVGHSRVVVRLIEDCCLMDPEDLMVGPGATGGTLADTNPGTQKASKIAPKPSAYKSSRPHPPPPPDIDPDGGTLELDAPDTILALRELRRQRRAARWGSDNAPTRRKEQLGSTKQESQTSDNPYYLQGATGGTTAPESKPLLKPAPPSNKPLHQGNTMELDAAELQSKHKRSRSYQEDEKEAAEQKNDQGAITREEFSLSDED